ncbi:MAG: hypothetical protein KAU36_06165 [candidate division Zixibacteria bacterium]|nr:hypothetical protein [candidate division Zixibacteria bacterium]
MNQADEVHIMDLRDTHETDRERQFYGKVTAIVIEQMKKGAGKRAIARELARIGIDEREAIELVEPIYEGTLKLARKEQYTSDALQPALFGGLLAAAVGGTLWGSLIVFTGYEVGFIAWTLGLISGYVVVWITHGKKGTPLQFIAVVSSILAILIGKYLSFYHLTRQSLMEDAGKEAAEGVSFFSEELFNAFVNNFPDQVSSSDVIWVSLAIVTAWSIPRAMGIKLPEGSYTPYTTG